MKNIHQSTFDYHELIKNLSSRVNFSFSRYGDGEWNCIFGKAGHNTDKHPYTPKLSEKLNFVIRNNPGYHLGLQSLGYRLRTDQIETLTKKYNLTWCDADIIHRASTDGRLVEMMDALKTRNLLMIAPQRMNKLRKVFPEACEKMRIIEIPALNCFKEYDYIRLMLEQSLEDDLVILYCASMMTKVLIDDVYRLKKTKLTQIDAGSVFEPYIGVANRKYHTAILDRRNRLNPDV